VLPLVKPFSERSGFGIGGREWLLSVPFWGIRVSDWCCGLSLIGGGLESRASMDESGERKKREIAIGF